MRSLWSAVAKLGALALVLLATVSCRGNIQIQRIMVDGLSREYVIHVPSTVGPEGPPPALLIMLHGTSGDGQRFYNLSHWVQTANRVSSQWSNCDETGSCSPAAEMARGGLITVFPSALKYCIGDDRDFDGRPEGWVVTTKWVSGWFGGPYIPLCPHEELARLPPRTRDSLPTLQRNGNRFSQSTPDDVAFLDALIERVSQQYGVDPERIFISGFSNGGQMAARMALERPDTFAGVAIAGAVPDLEGVADQPVPMVASVGVLDPLFLAYEDPSVDQIPLDDSAIRKVPAIALLVDNATRQAGLDPAAYSTEEGRLAGVETFTMVFDTPVGEDQGNRFELVLVRGVSHEYPNGENSPIVMSDFQWSFFTGLRR